MNVMKARDRTLPGVIDTLSTGFDAINRMIWIVLFPIVLDLFLWRGPQLSAAPAMRDFLRWYNAIVNTQMEAGGEPASEAMQGLERMRQGLEAMADQFNLFGVMAGSGPVLGMLPGVPALALAQPVGPTTVLAQPVTIVALVVTIALFGLLLGCVYLGLIAQQVRDGQIDVKRLVRRIWRYWLSSVGFGILAIGAGIVVGVPAGLLVSIASILSPGVGLILSGLIILSAQAIAVLMILYFFFIADAIVLSEAGPLRAVANSLRVVARNFGQTVLLIVLIFVISIGTQEIWRYLSDDSWGALVGIVANGYIVSGLTAARMLFYRNRLVTTERASETNGQTTG